MAIRCSEKGEGFGARNYIGCVEDEFHVVLDLVSELVVEEHELQQDRIDFDLGTRPEHLLDLLEVLEEDLVLLVLDVEARDNLLDLALEQKTMLGRLRTAAEEVISF